MIFPIPESIILVVCLLQTTLSSRLNQFEILEHSHQQGPKNCATMPNDPTRMICTCSQAAGCDELNFNWPQRTGEARLVVTTRSGYRFKTFDVSEILEENDAKSAIVRVDTNVELQTILGFGGAFTDAAVANINSLPDQLGQALLESYFGPQGLHYSLGRVPIAGSDFSPRAYSYDDSNLPDFNLSEWKLTPEDLVGKIPMIKRAMSTTSARGVELKLIASPWSPPKWMKTSNSFVRGHLIDDEKIYESYANYLVNFFEAYKRLGVPFWGATVQNEPVASYLPFYFFNSLQMSTKETVRLVADHLGPALEAKGYTKDNFTLMLGDDSLLFVDYQVDALADSRVQKYISGFAFHWYTNALIAPYSSLSKLIDSVQDKVRVIIMTEASNGAMKPWNHVDLGSWDRGEAYAIDIIEDMRRRTNAWIDWNLALDEQGGPNWAKNFVDSPIIVNKAKAEFYKQPMYYVLAHFTRFMPPNSVQVASELIKPSYFEKVMVLSVLIKDTNHLVINILNTASSARRLEFRINAANAASHALDSKSIQVEGKSINTLVLKL